MPCVPASTVSVPPWVSMITRLIARPSPMPLAFIDTKGSNSRARILFGMPLPLSRTRIHAQPSPAPLSTTTRGEAIDACSTSSNALLSRLRSTISS